MGFKQIPRIPVGADLFAPTADLSAFAGCSGIPLNLLKLIIGTLQTVESRFIDSSALPGRISAWQDG